MRALTASLLVLGLAVLAGGADEGTAVYRGKCGTRVLPRAPTGLPAPVELWTQCGVFVVRPNGEIRTRPGRGRWVVYETGPLKMDLPPARRKPRRVGIYSGLIRDRTGDMAAFTATEGYTGHIEPGDEVVYVLKRGGRAQEVLRQRMLFTLCGRGVQLSWHGTWLLYGAGEGYAVAIDTEGGRRIDLTATIRRLPGTRPSSGNYRLGSVYWA